MLNAEQHSGVYSKTEKIPNFPNNPGAELAMSYNLLY